LVQFKFFANTDETPSGDIKVNPAKGKHFFLARSAGWSNSVLDCFFHR
jgi:hypothetical protein